MLYPSSFEPLLESMMLVFDAGAHADRAATLRRGDVVSVEGQISRVSRMNIKLDHCEFVPNAGESPDSRVKPR
jgi:hypothetical protein